jgi:hypothetical protein
MLYLFYYHVVTNEKQQFNWVMYRQKHERARTNTHTQTYVRIYIYIYLNYWVMHPVARVSIKYWKNLRMQQGIF